MAITETQQQILSRAGELFFRYGIKSVSIDDICREMGMSKKTFYQHYSTKDELVEAMLDRSVEKMGSCLQSMLDKSDFGQLIGNYVSYHQSTKDDLRRIPTLVYDLQKYYPAQFSKFQLRTFEMQKSLLSSAFVRGKEEGYVREDLDVELTAVFFAKLHNDTVRDSEMLEAHGVNVPRLSRLSLEILVRGILTQKGLEVMESNNC